MEVVPFTLLIFFVIQIHANCFQDRFQPSAEPASRTESEEFQQILYENQLNFSLQFFHSLYKKHERRNLFFSPYSIHKALMLTLFGSNGETEQQLRTAMNLGDIAKTELVRQYKMEKYFMEARAQNTSHYDLMMASKIFFADTEPVRDCVLEVLAGDVDLMNFANETESSRKKINAWVASNTKDKIRNIIPPGSVTAATRIAIVNSAYFKGNWEKRFDRSKTKPELFYSSPKSVRRTEMMHLKDSFRHGVSEPLRAYVLEMPYKGEEISMFILLPPFAPNALEETLSRLTANTLRAAIDSNALYYDSIEVTLPKFHIEQAFELNKGLESIGVTDLFTEKADLSGFSTQEGLSIGSGMHRSFLEVNEEGAEGGGATVLIDTRSSRPLDLTQFICNHPFVYIIHDNVSKTVLFMGVYTNPKTSKRS